MLAPEPAFRPAGADWARAGAVAAALFILYALTAPRTVAVEDDGLFILSSYFFGIEHAPGFPLFTLVAKLFTLLPLGSVAYRVHLVSAFFGGLACGAAWLCARALTGARLPAYLGAVALGLTPVFWSQAVIAEVYTFNAFFFLTLLFLGLRAAHDARVLPWMAFLFGLSLANHWPLMLLVAPGFAILLLPRLGEIARRLPLYLALLLLGLLPYAWMVWRSWQEPIISYLGPLESWREVWHMLSRASYAEVDERLSASWFDRVRFLAFVGEQLAVQFALAGGALVAVGCAVQWRALGWRVSAGLLVAFLGPTALLIVLLGFDYDHLMKHVFHVYTLPAYAVAALWMALGFAWLARRYALRARVATGSVAALLALVLAWGARGNLLADYDWAARYAQTVLKILPADAVVFVQGDPDLGPIGYFHMIEGQRPDITLFQSKGLLLGNRLFHPLRTVDQAGIDGRIRKLVDSHTGPVVFTLDSYTVYARLDRWLYVQVDKSSTDPARVTVDIPEEAQRFFEESLATVQDGNAWAAFFQGELRRRYGILLGQSLPRGRSPDARAQRHLELLSKDYYGALGLAEGLLANREGYPPAVVSGLLETVRSQMPSDATKFHLSRFFYLRGLMRIGLNDRAGAIADLDTALSAWPVADNPALKPLGDLYTAANDTRALDAMQDRIRRRKR
jgi:4-amino-4-deoxy-L-arabinose transferase-like glycosyltransferase